MMIGTADEIIKAPEKGPVFVEDLPEEEQVVALVHTEYHSVHVLRILSLLVIILLLDFDFFFVHVYLIC